MTNSLNCLISSLDVGALIYLAVAVYVATRRYLSPANMCLSLVAFTCAIMSFTYHEEIVAGTLATKLTWMRIRLLFTPFLTPVWLMFIVVLTGRASRVRPSVWLLLFIVPVITVVMAQTMESHPWYRHGFTLSSGAALCLIRFLRGPWCVVEDVYRSVLGIVGLALIVRPFRTQDAHQRPLSLVLMVSSLLPLFASVVFSLWELPRIAVYPLPMVLLPAAVAMAWAVFRLGLFDISPAARSMVFDFMRDGVVIMNSCGRIVELNKSAESLIGPFDASVRWRESARLPDPWPGVFTTNDNDTCEFCFDTIRRRRWFERTRTAIQSDNKMAGWLFILHDITASREMQQRKLTEAGLQAESRRKEQWSNLLRDLHDGIGTISSTIGLLARLGSKASTAEGKEVYLSRIGELANAGNLEIRTMMNVLEIPDQGWPELFAQIRKFANMIFKGDGVHFDLKVLGVPTSETGSVDGLSLFRIVKEALSNTAKHAGACSVEVEFSFSDQQVQLSIRDNGQWREGGANGRGLRHIRQRMNEMGGSLRVETAPITQVICVVPLKR